MKRFFTMMLLAVSASAMMAQGSQQVIMGNKWFTATLPEFSFQGQVQMFVYNNGDNGTESFVFYDDDFYQQGTLTVQAETYDYTYKREEREGKYVNGRYIYTGDWQVKSEDSGPRYAGLVRLDFQDFDQSCDDFRRIYITQTLFNKDDKYEYLMPIITTQTYNNEEDRDGDGMIDYKETGTRVKTTGFMIVSETGTVLQTITFENNFYTNSSPEVSVLKVNGKLFLSFSYGYVDEGSEQKSAFLVYSLDTSANATSVRMKTMEIVPDKARYTLDGRRTKGERGINIIMEDGRVRKAVVK